MSDSAIRLGVNIDHAATLRQARYREAAAEVARFVEPDPVAIAAASLKAGADGLTVHLREDRRHIQDDDVLRLKAAGLGPINLEMALSDEIFKFALDLKPQSVCLVPENRKEVTTEGGLDAHGQREKLLPICAALKDAGVMVSLFIDPEPHQVQAAIDLKVPFIELHTGAYSNAYDTPARARAFEKLCRAAEQAHAGGLKVNAGHGINYINITEIRTLPHLYELNIGHSILSRALLTGIKEAIATMKRLMNEK